MYKTLQLFKSLFTLNTFYLYLYFLKYLQPSKLLKHINTDTTIIQNAKLAKALVKIKTVHCSGPNEITYPFH